jgi:hypothetical protein
MKDMQNKDSLVKLIDLYKQSKITKAAIEMELTKAVGEMTGNEVVQVKILEEVDSNTNTTFGAVSLPEKIGDKLLLTVLVDKDAVLNLVSPEELLSIISEEVKDHQKTLRGYSKFVKSGEENEFALADTLKYFLGLYKDSLKRVADGNSEVYTKLRSNRTIQSPELIQSEIDALFNNVDVHNVSERLVLSKKMPKAFLHAANELAKVSKNTLTDISQVSLFYKDEEPVMNQFYQQRRALSDGTYDLSKNKSKKVEHDYIPKTNQ